MTELETVLYCANHPTVETALRCNRCDKPICPKCAVSTPTGYRCKECVRGQQKIFDTALWYDYPISIVIAFILPYLGSISVRYIGFFAIFLGPVLGGITAEAIRLAIRKRRSRQLYIILPIVAGIGCVITPILILLSSLQFGLNFGLLGLLWYGIYAVGVVSTLSYRLSGIRVAR